MKVSLSCPYDNESFIQRLEKFRNHPSPVLRSAWKMIRIKKKTSVFVFRGKIEIVKKKTIGMVPNSKKSKKSKKNQEDEVEVAGDSNSELKEETEDKEDKFEDKQDKTHELHFLNYEDLTLEEATRLYNILKPPFPAKTATEFKGTEDDTEDEDEDDTEEKLEDKDKIEDKQDKTQELQFFNTEEKLEDPGFKEAVKVCMEAVDAGNLPLGDSSPTTAIKVTAGGYDAKADMEAEDVGGVIEILGKGGG